MATDGGASGHSEPVLDHDGGAAHHALSTGQPEEIPATTAAPVSAKPPVEATATFDGATAPSKEAAAPKATAPSERDLGAEDKPIEASAVADLNSPASNTSEPAQRAAFKDALAAVTSQASRR